MVHDLKGPVRTANQCLQILEQRHAERLEDDLWQVARRAIALLDSRLEAILRFAAVKVGLHREFVDMHPVVDKAAEQVLRETTRPMVIEIRELPPCLGDAVLLEQVFWNLLDNAAKYSGRGHIIVGGRRAGPDVEYWVRDAGPGIPASLREEVFEPFRRGPASVGTIGHGLGLAIVERIVLGHGGRVSASSGPGTTIKIRLPGSLIAS